MKSRTPDSLFAVGSKVVYPSHGVAEIIRREKREFNGEKRDYLVLMVPQQGWGTSGGMTLSVPEDAAADLGVRAAISSEDAAEVLDVLAVRDVRVPANWSRRFKNHQEKLKSGDVYQCAEVVRNLAARLRTAQLSAAEQSMYAKARYILISELAVSWDTDDEAAEARIDEVLGLTPTDLAPRGALRVEAGDQLLRRDHAVGVLADPGDLVPVEIDVEADADPAAAADVRRAEEPVRLGFDQRLLRAGRRRAPEVREVVAVVAVVPQLHEHLLVADEPRRRAVARPLGHLGERETDRAHPVDQRHRARSDRYSDAPA